MVFPGLFALTAMGANHMAGKPVRHRVMILQLAYILIPIGIFTWIAFSLPAVMVNYGYILAIVSDPLGLGWDLFGSANLHFPPLIPEWIPTIQGVLLLAGLYFGLSRGFAAIGGMGLSRSRRIRGMILPTFFMLIVVNLLLKLYLG